VSCSVTGGGSGGGGGGGGNGRMPYHRHLAFVRNTVLFTFSLTVFIHVLDAPYFHVL
jgi:hypothetical protein